jgi:hypothetical protein
MSAPETEATRGGARQNLGMRPAETPRRAGRPTVLSDVVADRVVAELYAGGTLDNAAARAGISPRTLRSWRERAWSQRPEDQPFVRLEQGVRLALARARLAPEPASEPPPEPAPEPWQDIAARLAADDPLNWGPLGDVDVGDDWLT